MGDIARLHSAVIAYARDFMIDRGFTYVIPPYMIRSDVVTGVMSFAEMDSMMYKIEGEDLYLVGTSEHSMIGKFIDQILSLIHIYKNGYARRNSCIAVFLIKKNVPVWIAGSCKAHLNLLCVVLFLRKLRQFIFRIPSAFGRFGVGLKFTACKRA